MKRIKQEYLNKKITEGGIQYDFAVLSQEKLDRIHANNPSLRKYFEDELTEEEREFIARIEKIEDDAVAELKEIGIETPEQFEEQIKKAAAKPRKRK